MDDSLAKDLTTWQDSLPMGDETNERLDRLEARVSVLEVSILPRRKAGSVDGRSIREARKAAGWTMQHLAGLLGVTRQAVWRWEAGASLLPAARIDAVMNAFSSSGVTPPRLEGKTNE